MMTTLDEALAQIGGLGREQFQYCLILCLVRIAVGVCYLSYTFVRAPVPFMCNSGNSSNSHCTDECSEYEFDVSEGDSLASEWALVCKE